MLRMYICNHLHFGSRHIGSEYYEIIDKMLNVCCVTIKNFRSSTLLTK